MNQKIYTIPYPHSINILYKRMDGRIKRYPRVVPIELKDDKFSGYVFGEGVRSFKFNQIIEVK